MRPRALLKAAKGPLKRLARPVAAALDGPPKRLTPERFGLVAEARGGLSWEGVNLDELLRTHGSPLHVVSLPRLRRNAERFLTVPAGCAAGCEVFYSYKTNPVRGVLERLLSLGVGAEVISPFELWLAQQLGVPPARTIYNGPAKSDASLRDAIASGIEIINCNHREELPRVASIARDLGRRARVGIRISTDQGWSGQFGTPLADGQALDVFRDALRQPELEVVGLHQHRGGMIRSELELTLAIAPVLNFVEELRRELGITLDVLNFGGSLASPTVRGLGDRDKRHNRLLHREPAPPDADGALTIERYLEVLIGTVERHFAERGQARPRIMVEPGRALTSDTQLLLATVLTTKASPDVPAAVIDAGINLAESVKNEYHELVPVSRHGAPRDRVYSVVGPICSPGDVLYGAVRLPELRAGDSLAILDAGAYFVPFATSFSFPQPAIVAVDGGEVTVLRRRETFEDRVAYEARP